MPGKTCLITGANSGIGKASAIQIARDGCHVIIGCRNKERGGAALREIREQSGNDAVELLMVDMSLQSSVKKAAEQLGKDHQALDVLIQNAAIFDITQKEPRQTDEGIESIWATNHMGPVLLTESLVDLLKQSSQGRIITIASKGLMAMPFLKVNLEDPEFKRRKFSVATAYYQSKMAQLMYTYRLAERLKDTGITVNCIRVPSVRVDLNKYPNLSKAARFIYSMKMKSAMDPEEMAKTYAHLATSKEVAQFTGKYFDENCRPVKSSRYSMDAGNISTVMELTNKYLNGSVGY